MDYWQYLSLGDLEQNEFLPKSKSWGFLVTQRLVMITWPTREQKLKMKDIVELVANLLCLDKKMGISERR